MDADNPVAINPGTNGRGLARGTPPAHDARQHVSRVGDAQIQHDILMVLVAVDAERDMDGA
eukprot:11164915-Lingulodinium_polyedra.AAC.1